MTLDKWKNFTYGSSKVHPYQDGRTTEAIGTTKYDDEGVPSAASTELVRDGQFVGYLKSRDSAIYKNGVSNGTARAQGWKNVPIVRMTNIHQPGNETLDELISSTQRGILMEDNSSWSIDDRRWNFQFATEIGWMVEKGKITDMVKYPTYRYNTRFLG